MYPSYFTSDHLNRLRTIGGNWAAGPARGQSEDEWLSQTQTRYHPAVWWGQLIGEYADARVEERPSEPALPLWWNAAMKLMLVADEAAVDFGYLLPPDTSRRFVAFVYMQYERYLRVVNERGFEHDAIIRDYRNYVSAMLDSPPGFENSDQERTSPFLPFMPISLCRSVIPFEACVQPKGQTPQVGVYGQLICPQSESASAVYRSPVEMDVRLE